MIYAQPGSSFTASLENASTGLTGTLGVQILNHEGTVVFARKTAGITEIPAGSGQYLVTLTAPTGPGLYIVFWDNGVISPSTTASEELTITSILPGPPSLSIGPEPGPNAPPNVHQTIVSSDDYLEADGRALTWSRLPGPSLVNAELELLVGYDANNIYGSNLPIIYKTNVKNSEEHIAKVPLTKVQTTEILEGCYDYILRATLVDKSVVTVAFGKFTVLAPPGQAPLQPL